MPLFFWELAVGLSILPDADVIAFRLGIPYADPFGHRGFTHSLLFALFAGLLASLLTYRWLQMNWLAACGASSSSATASHGVIDAFTGPGGLGIAFFWPFDDTRYFFPWQPIKVPHIGMTFFTSGEALPTMLSEVVWVWLPTGVVVGLVLLWRRLRRGPLLLSCNRHVFTFRARWVRNRQAIAIGWTAPPTPTPTRPRGVAHALFFAKRPWTG